MYLNHVINFFFYCLLGPKFRNEVLRLLPFFKFQASVVYPLNQMSKRPTIYAASSVSMLTKKENQISTISNSNTNNNNSNSNINGSLSNIYNNSWPNVKRLSSLKESFELCDKYSLNQDTKIVN